MIAHTLNHAPQVLERALASAVPSIIAAMSEAGATGATDDTILALVDERVTAAVIDAARDAEAKRVFAAIWEAADEEHTRMILAAVPKFAEEIAAGDEDSATGILLTEHALWKLTIASRVRHLVPENVSSSPLFERVLVEFSDGLTRHNDDVLAQASRPKLLERLTNQNEFDALAPPATAGVYAVRDSAGFVKIGRAKNIAKRMHGMRTSHANPPILIAVLSEDPNDEFAFHDTFRSARIRGEWFEPVPELLEAIRRARREIVLPVVQERVQ